jgi:ABC-type transporter Mla MlaB component
MPHPPVSIPLSARHQTMEQPRSVVSPLFPHSLPAAQEAAVLYANGREADAADFLRRALAPGQAGSAGPELWIMLFDLLRVRGEWQQFEGLAQRFEAAFSSPAPQWLNEEEMTRLPPDLRPGGAGYFELAGALDAEREGELNRVRAAARDLATVHLNVSRLAGLDAEGCSAFLKLMHYLPDNGNGLVITGGDHLADLLQHAAEGNPTTEAYWALLLALHQVRGLQKDFERCALEYALAVGTEPPAWQPMVMPVTPRSAPEEKRDEPRYQAGPEILELTGAMWGAADPQLGTLHAFGEERQYVNINLSQLQRMDFGCGNAFANSINEWIAGGKTVRLIRPNSLVAAFLSTLSLSPDVNIVTASRAT